MFKTSRLGASETVSEDTNTGSGMGAVLVAQADTGSGTTSGGEASGGTPGISIIVPDAENRVTLAASASIEDIQLDGDDLLLIQPDGSQIRIIGGALNVPTFVIGDIEVQQEVLVAALETRGFNVAAGPNNTLSVTQQPPAGSGGQLEDSSGATIIDGQQQALGLLGDDAGDGNGAVAAGEIVDPGNIVSVLAGGVSTGEIVESVDNPGGIDADPVAATGSITFFDPDFGETRDAEVTSRTVASQVLVNGGTLTAAQLDALLAGFSLDTPGGITVESTTAAGGSIDWTYAVGNAAVDFLASGEVITLSFDVRINDGILSVSQTVTITITGTNDQPVFEANSVLADSITEQTDTTGAVMPLTASGQIVLSDVDLTDTHTTNQTLVSAVWSGGADRPVDPGVLVIDAVNQGAGTVRWIYTVADSALDFLGAGETLTITYDVTVRDSSATANASSPSRQVVVTITGTNDVPVITSGAQTGTVEETADVVGGIDPDPAAATGTISFLDVDLSDDPEASHDGGTVSNMSFAHGYTPTDEQIAALKAGFSLDDAALSNFSNGTGSTGWTYQVANAVVDFLGAGDSVELTYVVTIDDGKGGTVTQNVVVTVTGTSDAPTVTVADNFVVNEEDLTNGNTGALIFSGDVGLNFNDYSSVGLSARLKTSGAIPLDPSGGLILLSSDGQSLGYSLLTRPSEGSQKLAAFNFRTGEIIFVLDVKIVADGSGGFKVEYTFELRGNLDHIGPGDGNSMPLDFTVTATNSAGETASNTFTVTINDDVPDAANVTATMEENTATLISLVEGDGAAVEAGQAYISGADDATVTLGTPTFSNLPAGVVPGTPGIALVQTATGYDVSITPGSAFDALAEGESMLMEIPFTVEDSDGDTVTKVIVVTVTGTNDQPVITSGAQTGSVEETADVVGGADPDPAAATGIISFLDVDLSDDPEASHDGGTVTNTSFAHGYTPTDEQIAALKAGFSLDDAALSNFSNTTGIGSTGWTYQVANAAVDFLGDGDSVELTYAVTINDGNGGTVTQNVVVTVTGTSDAPTVTVADNFVVNEEDLTNGNSGALTFAGDVGLNYNAYSSSGLGLRLKTSGAIPLNPAGDLILLSSDGQALGYSLLTRPGVSQTLAAFNFRTGEIIFVLEVKIVADGSGGFKVAYTFELRGNLDHTGPGDGNSVPLDFTVTATNSAGETAENTFTVTINDDTPDAADVTATMEENTATLISLVEGDGADLEAGDAYISGADEVTVTLGTPTYSNLPAGVVPGTPDIALVQTATGYDVSITPGTAFDALAEGESMLMEIPFTVEDSDGDTVTKVITVTVTGTNDQPLIAVQTDVSEILTETDAALSTAGSFDVVDVDVSDVVTITGVTVATSGTGVNAATPGTAALLSLFGPNSGVVIDSLSNSGTVSWTFDAGSGVFDYLKAGESIELTYTVDVADGHGGLVDQDVTITINGTNDAPVIAPITQPSAVAEIADASAQDISSVAGTISVTDADAGDTLTAQAGTPVIAWSGGVLSSAQLAALTAALATGALTLGGPVSSDSSAGIGYSWDPSAADLDFLAQGQTLTVTYDITVSDGTATSSSQPLVFTIAGSNDLPDAVNDNPNGSLPEFRMSEDETVAKVFDVLSNDTLDTDAGATNNITLGTIRGYGVPGLAAGTILDPVSSGLFTISVDINNQIQVALNNSAWQSMRRGETAKIVIDYRLEGDGTDFALGSLQVEVTGSNDAPVLEVTASPSMTQAEDAALPSGDVGTLVSTLVSAPGGSVGNVNDPDGRGFAPGISITAFDTSHGTWYYHLDGVNASNGDPYWFNANLTPGQVLNLRAQDKIYFVPDPDYTGTIDQAITFRAWDGVASQLGKISAPGSVGGETAYSADTDTASLTVDNVNDAPVLVASISDETVFSNADLDIDVTASFSDIDPGDILAYSATLANGDPLPAWLSIDSATGRLTGTAPVVGVAGETLQITVTATDSGSLSVSDTFELAIDSAPVAPVITAHTDGGVTEDASYAGGTNLTTNGGFETGNSSGWSFNGPYVSGYFQYVHSGAYAAGGWSVYAPYAPATLSQTFSTVAGATYTISFWAQNNGNAAPDNSLNVTWNGASVASIVDLAYAGPLPNYTEFTYTFTATSDSSTLALAIENRVNYTFVDDISVVRLPGTETTSGTISFTDLDVGDTHTASFTPAGTGYLGSFAATVGAESSAGSTGTVNWTFNVADADIQHLAAGETVTQTYTVTIGDGNGGTVSEDIDVTLTGVNDNPTLTGLDGVTFLENTVNNAPQLIDANVTFADVDTGNLDTGTLTVSGFVSGEDTIGINDEGAGAGNITVSGANVLFGGTVIGTFTGGSGANNLVVTFNSSATAAAVDALIENLTYANSSDTPTASRTLTISITDGDGGSVTETSVVNVTEEVDVPPAIANSDFINPIPVGWTWLADNGHIYKYVSTNHFWSGAVTAAAGEIAGQSYLATSTGAAEDALIDTLATGRTHLGGSDATTEGTWQWMTGPEAGEVFWIGGVGGSAQNGAFNNWSPANPGNVSGYGSAENYLATDLSDNWNDVDASNSGLPTIGYMSEAGGLNGQVYAAITEDAAFTFSESWLLANDTNAPANILSVLTSTKGALVSYNAGTGEITYDATGSSILQALNAGETTTDTFTYTISDGNGGISSSVVTLTVAGADEVPVTGDAGDNALFGGAGGDLINGGAGRDTLTGGDGADAFVFDADALLDAGAGIRDLIADYDFAEGDVVDLSLLLGDEPVAGHAADYVKMNGAFLEVDVDGTAGGAGFVRIAEFTDVPAINGLRILVDDDPAHVTVVI